MVSRLEGLEQNLLSMPMNMLELTTKVFKAAYSEPICKYQFRPNGEISSIYVDHAIIQQPVVSACFRLL